MQRHDGGAGVCLSGVCREKLCEGVVCDDGNECTRDRCDYADGTCDFILLADGTWCGHRRRCVGGVCIYQ